MYTRYQNSRPGQRTWRLFCNHTLHNLFSHADLYRTSKSISHKTTITCLRHSSKLNWRPTNRKKSALQSVTDIGTWHKQKSRILRSKTVWRFLLQKIHGRALQSVTRNIVGKKTTFGNRSHTSFAFFFWSLNNTLTLFLLKRRDHEVEALVARYGQSFRNFLNSLEKWLSQTLWNCPSEKLH